MIATSIYTVTIRDEQHCTYDYEIEATDRDDAIQQARDSVAAEATDWCEGGSWGDDGAEIDLYWSLTDEDGEEIARDGVSVTIDPDHSRKIAALFGRSHSRPDDWCGDDPDDHEWTSEGEGGCAENPGVWSLGGTTMKFASHCRCCGLRREEITHGSQKNPGETDTVEYSFLDED